jgi:hypothetical protein
MFVFLRLESFPIDFFFLQQGFSFLSFVVYSKI